MINFRYHIVSITAVFLALGIGTALGSTFLDGPTVDLLNRNIRSAESRIAATEAENARLSRADDLARARDLSLLLDGGGRLLGDLLVDVPTVIIVGPGVDGDTAVGVREGLRSSGADLRAIVTLEDRMSFEGDLDVDLAEDMGLTPTTPAALRQAVNRELAAALVAAGRPVEGEAPADGEADPEVPGDGDGEPGPGAPADGEAGPEVPGDGDAEPGPGAPADGDPGVDPEPEAPGVADGTQPAIVTALLERGYLDVEAEPGIDPDAPLLDVPGHRYVIVTSDDADRPQGDVVIRLIQATPEDDLLPVVVVGPTRPAPEVAPDADAEGAAPEPVGDVVERIRADEDLRRAVATVDDIDAYSGIVATILVLDELDGAVPGHYGQGDDAQSVLPPGP